MKAMILAAGLGTRLHPLTQKRPKALIPIMNRPMIARVIAHLKAHGVDEIIVNAHHHAGMLVDYLADGSRFGVKIETRFEPEILGTGGGIRNTADFWDAAPFIVANADTLTDIDLRSAVKAHKAGGALSTLIIHDRPRFSKIQVDAEGWITDISRDVTPGRLAFTGIHVIEPALLDFIRPGVFSDIIDCYRDLIRMGRPPRAFVSRGHNWHDVGTIESYLRVHEELCLESPPADRFVLGSGCVIHPLARLLDWAVLGDGVELGEGALVSRSVICDGARVGAGVKVCDSVVGSDGVVKEDLAGGRVMRGFEDGRRLQGPPGR